MWSLVSEVKLSDDNSIKVIKDYDEKYLATFLLVKDIKNVEVIIPFDAAIWILFRILSKPRTIMTFGKYKIRLHAYGDGQSISFNDHEIFFNNDEYKVLYLSRVDLIYDLTHYSMLKLTRKLEIGK